MKTLKSLLYLLVVFAIVLSACKKNVHKITDDPEIQLSNMEDLVVPPDFDWRMYMGPGSSLKSTTTYYPSLGYNALAFEDLWPAKGDYDFNDLVVEYRFSTEVDESDNIIEIIGTFVFRALGAGTFNGFGFEITGMDTTGLVVTGNSLSGDYVSATDGWEDGQSSPVVIVAEDLTDVLDLYSNTMQYGITNTPRIVTIKITPRAGVDVDVADFTINEDSFNPFMVIDWPTSGRFREVHMVDYTPTDLADLSYWGTMDDNSTLDFGISTYKTDKNFPWVLEIPSDITTPTVNNPVFDWPQEKKDINWAYLHFDEWVESNGVDYGSGPTSWWIGATAEFRFNANIYYVP